MDQARQLFADYKYYRIHTANIQKLKKEKPYLRELKETPERLKLMAHMAAWCEQRGINPRLWLYSLFVSRRWLFAPKLESSNLISKKHLPKFQRLKDYTFYREYQQVQEAANPSPEAFDPNRDISSTAEQAKRYYLSTNSTQTCMSRMKEETFGYHPKSPVCLYCPISAECKTRLEASVTFDIIALRQGKLTSEEARRQALARVQGHGR